MNKSDLVSAIASTSGFSKTDSEKFLNALQDVVIQAVKTGDKITLTGFFSIEKSERKATTGRNPRTGSVIDIPAKNVVKIKAGKLLSDAAN